MGKNFLLCFSALIFLKNNRTDKHDFLDLTPEWKFSEFGIVELYLLFLKQRKCGWYWVDGLSTHHKSNKAEVQIPRIYINAQWVQQPLLTLYLENHSNKLHFLVQIKKPPHLAMLLVLIVRYSKKKIMIDWQKVDCSALCHIRCLNLLLLPMFLHPLILLYLYKICFNYIMVNLNYINFT